MGRVGRVGRVDRVGQAADKRRASGGQAAADKSARQGNRNAKTWGKTESIHLRPDQAKPGQTRRDVRPDSW